MKKFVIGNWKELPETQAQAREVVERVDQWLQETPTADVSIVLCPPDKYLHDVADWMKQGRLADVAQLGVQDVTGGAEELGVRYVIIGHSDRRWKLGEPDDVVNGKLKATLRAGLVPIVCLGERTREPGWQDALATQVRLTFAGLSDPDVTRCMVAYEPVWAISTNPGAKPDTPASAVQSMGLIRQALEDSFGASHATFLYGGSVTPANAREFLQRPEVSGVLVGGASVRPEDFVGILTIAATL